jgi:hypothetical protein
LAFCSALAQRQLYIRLPTSLIKLINDSKYSTRVLKLNKTLYGLLEASRSFHDMLNQKKKLLSLVFRVQYMNRVYS